MHEPVLSDPVFLPCAGPQAGLRGEFLKDEEATHAHNRGAQLPGGHHCPSEGPQPHPALLQLLRCSQGQERLVGILSLRSPRPLLFHLWLHSSSSWTCTTVTGRPSPRIRSLCSWRKFGTHHCRPTKSLLASSPLTTATPGPRPTIPSSKVPPGQGLPYVPNRSNMELGQPLFH